MTPKEQIIELFRKNVKGKVPDVTGKNKHHDGKKGHWLEEQFGIAANANNKPDLLGYELKNETKSKKTFGDWSANIYVYTNPEYKSVFDSEKVIENRDKFIRIFGHPSKRKEGRYSWSGTPCPKIDSYNDFGQILLIEPNKDIVALYSYSYDKRPNKANIVPNELQIENLEIARWYGERSPTPKSKCLKAKLEDKFGKGWFTCETDNSGKYVRIRFGKAIHYDEWLDWVKKGNAFFDGGMYTGNKRPYSQWRANNKFWDELITETYE